MRTLQVLRNFAPQVLGLAAREPERKKDIPAHTERKNAGSGLSFPAICKELEYVSP